MSPAEQRYVPAAGRGAFTRLYDPVLALTMRERTFRGQLVEQLLADLPPSGTCVLDVGCGTGTFAIAVAAAVPDAKVIGIDGDPEVLTLARAKPGADRVAWIEGTATGEPLPDQAAHAVVMSLLIHHLVPAAKRAALAEAGRVLRPGGRLHIADWGRPHDPLMRAAFLLVQLADGFEGTRDHASGRLPKLVAEAGFLDVTRGDRLRTAWGSLELLAATKSTSDTRGQTS